VTLPVHARRGAGVRCVVRAANGLVASVFGPAGRHATRRGIRRRVGAVLAISAVLGTATTGWAFAYMATSSAGPSSGETEALSAPTDVQATLTGGAVALSWVDPSPWTMSASTTPAVGYLVLRCTATGCAPLDPVGAGGCRSAITTPLVGTGCTDTDVRTGGTYRYAVVAVYGTWESPASAPTTVSVTAPVVPTAPAPAVPSVHADTTSGPVGEEVSLVGVGYDPATVVTVTIGSTSLATTPGTVVVGTDGTWATTVSVPVLPAGTFVITAGDTAGATASAAFTVDPAVDVSPDAGAPGSQLTLSGAGFAATATITVTFGGSDVTPTGGISTDNTGSFSEVTVTVPSSAAPGISTLTVTDNSGGSASSAYTVQPQP
jgi:hypothetical protein